MKTSRSRSQHLKGDSDSTHIFLKRPFALIAPKKITFYRGENIHSKSAYLDENKWVKLPNELSSLISHEYTMVTEIHAIHVLPPTPQRSVGEILSNFERQCIITSDPLEAEQFRSFVLMISSLFSAHVSLCLLYDLEMNNNSYEAIIKANPLFNSPSIYLLRFLYYFPDLMSSEDIADENLTKLIQKYIKKLIRFCKKNSNLFILPEPPMKNESRGDTRINLIIPKEKIRD